MNASTRSAGTVVEHFGNGISITWKLPLAVQRAQSAVRMAPVVIPPAPVPSCGIVDDGYADSDHTSRWIARMERPYV